MSMKPGATTQPSASSVSPPVKPSPISTIRSFSRATSARTPGAPVPSTTVPPRITIRAVITTPSSSLRASLTRGPLAGQPRSGWYVLRVILNSFPSARAATPVLVVVAALVGTGCGSSAGSGVGDTSTPTVVVTTPVLGSVVREVVGDSAAVDVLMPEGLDPHDWEPSAKD